MKTILVFLLLGVIVNIAVAWGCAIVQPFEDYEALTYGSWASGREGEAIISMKMGSDPKVTYPPTLTTDFGLGWTVSMGEVGHVYGRAVICSGFPFRCFSGEIFSGAEKPEYSGLWVIPFEAGDGWGVPYRPLIIGFFFNTVFFAGFSWVIWNLIGKTIDYFRKEPGTCPKCKYDLRGACHEYCPECGADVKAIPASD